MKPLAQQAEVAARRAEVVRRKAHGERYATIARDLGISEDLARQDALHAHRQRAAELRDTMDAVIASDVEELDALRLLLWRIALTEHPKVSNTGRIVVDDTGQAVHDPSYAIQAARVIAQVQDRRSRLLGYDAALKIDIKAEVSIDAIDAKLRELRGQIAGELAAGTGDETRGADPASNATELHPRFEVPGDVPPEATAT